MEFPEAARQRHSIAFERQISHFTRTKAASDVVHEHPGWLVREHIFAPIGASTSGFAHAVGVSQDFPECFLAGDHDVDLDLAQRPGPSCGISQKMWLELQRRHQEVW
ncbi:hypothetical protein [Stenotrophomonas sp. AB1(2024)]|uniref:hypothetical protein n=1 Tax=Stenotrophomonas sp. AB1(2024) TaxID=3132215 RepID=UPI0030B694FE